MRVCWYTLLMEAPHTHVMVTGSVSYREESGPSHALEISSKLSLADFLRYRQECQGFCVE